MCRPPIDISAEQWAILRRVLQRHICGYEVWAFGSRAQWTARPYSDLDLAIIANKRLDSRVMSALTDDLSESNLPWTVDVLEWVTLGDAFRQIVVRDKVVLQSGSSTA